MCPWRLTVVAATFACCALSMVSCIARRVTTYPNPQLPSTTVVVGVSWTIVQGAPGTMWPTWMRSMYVGI